MEQLLLGSPCFGLILTGLNELLELKKNPDYAQARNHLYKKKKAEVINNVSIILCKHLYKK